VITNHNDADEDDIDKIESDQKSDSRDDPALQAQAPPP
jgi:hypothetical protein